MCLVDKCCYFVPLEYSCILVGGGSLVLSTLMASISTVFLIMEENSKHWHKEYLRELLHVEIKEISITIILWIVLVLNLLWIIASILLLVGLKMNKPSLVLSYFTFGIFVTILILLSAILELLQSVSYFWVAALIKIIASLIFIHYLVAVHSVYELMLKGKHFGLNRHRRLDEEPIMESIH